MLVDNYVIKLWLYCTKLPIKIALYPLFDWIRSPSGGEIVNCTAAAI